MSFQHTLFLSPLRFFRIGFALFFVVAGINHFVMPDFYQPLIPPYFPFPVFLNYFSGFIELVAGLGLLFRKTRRIAVFSIIVLMLVFIPSHVYFIRMGSCIEGSLCVAPWIAWVRLWIIHPLLILSAWVLRK